MKKVLFGQQIMHLVGEEIKVGDLAKTFTCTKEDLSTYTYQKDGKKTLISVVPSLDTGICEMQTTRFNKEASNIKNLNFLTISCDLPFAQKRFCQTKDIKNILVLSDHKDLDFGLKYGLIIKELRLLTRAIILINEDGFIEYLEICDQIKEHPNYEKVLSLLKQ